MYINEFKNILNQGKRNSAYLFYGESNFLIDFYIKKIIVTFNILDNEIEKMYHEDFNFLEAKNKLLQSSLFSKNNLLIVKTTKKIPPKDMKELLETAQSNPNATLIFSIYSNEKLSSLEKLFTKKSDFIIVRFFNPNNHEAIEILNIEAVKQNINFTADAISYLYSIHEHDLELCMNDFNKLKIFDQQITSKTISQHCIGMGTIHIDDFLHDLLENKNVNDQIQTILEEGINEIFLISQINSFVQQLFMINSYTRINGFPNAKEILGYIPPPNVWKKKISLASKIKQNIFFDIMIFYNELELELKSNKYIDSHYFFISNIRKHSVIFS